MGAFDGGKILFSFSFFVGETKCPWFVRSETNYKKYGLNIEKLNHLNFFPRPGRLKKQNLVNLMENQKKLQGRATLIERR